jgi:hypothetical protein
VLFPASEEEKELVHETMHELKASLLQSATLGNTLISLLNENYLAISKEYRKELLQSVTEIDAFLWHLSLQLHNMNKNKERIVCAPQQKSC